MRLSGLSTGLRTTGSLVRFPVRTHFLWVSGQVPSRGHMRGNHPLMFLSLSFSLPSPLCKNNINKISKKKRHSSLRVLTFSGHPSVKVKIIRTPNTNSFFRPSENLISWLLLAPHCCSGSGQSCKGGPLPSCENRAAPLLTGTNMPQRRPEARLRIPHGTAQECLTAL